MKKAGMLMAIIAAASLGGVAVAAPATADVTQPQTSSAAAPLDKQDKSFLEEAAQSSLMDVRLGQLGVKQAEHPDVRSFAQEMIDEHTKIKDRLAEIAQAKGVVMPQALDKTNQDKIDKLAQLQGDKFDREFMREAIDAHKSGLKAFEKETTNGKDPELKQVAATTVPILQEHLTRAKEIASRVKK